MYIWRESRVRDVIELAKTMDDMDRRELADSGYSSPYAGLLASFNMSHQCYTVLTDKLEVVCIFGVVRNGGWGTIWMLSSGMSKHKFQMMKWTPMFLRKMSKGLKQIGNRIPTYQESHIKWLERLEFDFQIHPIEDENGVEWYYFHKEVEDV